MTCNNSRRHPPLFASGHYYSKEDFQFTINAVSRTIIRTTALKNNDGITLLYFRSGQGHIIINSKRYPIQRGILMCLASYHYFQIDLSEGTIELTQCQISYDTFLYMAANPYYDFSQMNLREQPLTSFLQGDMIVRAEHVIDELVETSIRKQKKIDQRLAKTESFRHKGGTTDFFLCMRLMGILQKTYQDSFWK